MTRRDQDKSGKSPLGIAESVKLFFKIVDIASGIFSLAIIVLAVFKGVWETINSLAAFSGLLTLITTVWLIRRRGRVLDKTRQQYPKLSIVGIMRLRKASQTQWALVLLLLSLTAYVGLSIWIDYALDKFIAAILALLIILLAIGQIIFDHRVRHGLYGNNEREARDIVNFIIQHSSDIDFTDGGKLKKIISDEDLKKIEQVALEAVRGTVS